MLLSNQFMLKIVASEIEKQLSKDVTKFDLIYNANSHQTSFRVFEVVESIEKSDLYAYEDSKTLSNMIKTLAETQLKNPNPAGGPGQKLELVIVHYNAEIEEQNYADIYFIESGEKIHIKFNY